MFPQQNTTSEAIFPSTTFVPSTENCLPSSQHYDNENLQCLPDCACHILQQHHSPPYTFEGYEIISNSNSSPSLNVFPSDQESLSSQHEGVGQFMNCSQPSQELEVEDSKKLLAKVARYNRKMARQRSMGMQKNSSIPYSTQPFSSTISTSTSSTRIPSKSPRSDEDLYTFSTPYNVKLRFLLEKVLTSSDVGDRGIIVLPKREAEVNLPSLPSKEGIPIAMKEVFSEIEWHMRFRFWDNSKGRMYILEQCASFVKGNLLGVGDILTIYEDQQKNLYFTIRRTEGQGQVSFDEPNSAYDDYMPISMQAEEEDSSLRILVEELRQCEQPDANNLMSLYWNDGSSASSSNVPIRGQFFSRT